MIKKINTKTYKKKIYLKPFKHIVIDNFLEKKFLRMIMNEFPKYGDKTWHQYDNYCENKKTNNQWNTFQPYTYKLFTKLNSAKFLKDLKKLFKEKEIFSDHGLHGGGLNIMKNSTGKLNPHLDNSYHPKTDLLRKYNLIIFLNKNWKVNWGGELIFYNQNKDNPKVHGSISKKIGPFFNRAIIFDTSKNSWHSVNNIIKKKNLFRKSIAVYYFVNKKNLKKKRLKVLYSPTELQRNNKAVLKFIKKDQA